MKPKDLLIAALAPLSLLLIPLIGNMTSPSNWKWTASDFFFAWVVLATAAFLFRLLLTRQWSNWPYKVGSVIAVAAGLLITWLTMAVQIIGDRNPANLLYGAVILTGLVGVGLARFKPTGMAKAAFATAAATFVVPIIAVIVWPSDFSPGIPQVFALNFAFVLMFVAAGLLFKRAAAGNG
jgi:hypothetical protein